MLDVKLNDNGMGNNSNAVTALNIYQRQSPIAAKKTAVPLKDIQNENNGSLQSCTENPTSSEEKANVDSIKVAGSKRIVPDCPPGVSSSPALCSASSVAGTHNELDKTKKTQDSCFNNGTNSHSTKFFHNEMPQQKKQVTWQDINFGPSFPPIMPAAAAPLMNFSSAGPSVPISLIKPNNPRISVAANHEDYKQKLLNMTSAELSRHAIELEKREMQLTKAAKKEMERKTELNINLTPSSGQQGVPKFK